MEIDLKLVNIDRLQDAMVFAREELSPRATLKGATNIILTNIQARFLAEVSPDGDAWVPSALARAEGRATLFRTGKLFEGLYAKYNSEFEWQIGYDDRATPYGEYFQEGRGQVQRKFLGLYTTDYDEVTDYIEERIADVMRRGYNHRG
jgi:phage gpG-like protein